MSKIEIEDVQRLDVQPGDVLLVTVPEGTTQADAERIRAGFETALPVRVLLKSQNIQVETVGPERVR